MSNMIKSHKSGPAVRMKLIIDSNVDKGWNSFHYAIYYGLSEVVQEMTER